jgi:hypothetical protein
MWLRPSYDPLQSAGLNVIAAISLSILAVEFGFLFVPLVILGTVCFVLVLVVSRPLSWVLGIVIARLTGSDRLRGIVVSLGIAVFIVGNALQLWATWLSDSQK